MRQILALGIASLFLTIVAGHFNMGLITIGLLGITIFLFLSFYITVRHDVGF
jgi:hypothetical protein